MRVVSTATSPVRTIRSRRAFLALAATLALGSAAFASTSATYTGPNGNWSLASNWSTSPTVPINGGGNTYAVTINSKTVTYNVAGSSQIDALTMSQSTLSLSATDNLTVLNASSILQSTVSANASTFSDPGTTDIDATSLSASNAGLVSLTSLTAYTANNLANFLNFTAQGSTSKVSLPALTTITFQGNTLTLSAQTAGTVDCPQLSTLTYTSNGVLALNATGANSLVNVPLLGNAAQINVNATVATGGTINWGSPTNLQQSNITLNTAGTINTTALTNINATSLTATGGATLTLPSVTTYTANNLANFLTFSAQAASSKVSLPALTTVVFQGNTLTLSAQTGGTVDCPQLSTLTYTSNGVLALSATGANSLVNVPLLGNAAQINVNATVATGGTINWGAPTSLQQSTITLNTAGTINTTALTNINATSLTATNGGTLTLPSVTTYTANNLANFLTFSAQAASSKVSLPALTTITFQGNTLTLSAQTAGTVDCPQLSTLTYTSNGVLSLNATGANSLVNVPLLGNAAQINVNATVATGGTINWGSPTSLQQSNITLNTAGTINTTALTNINATSLTATNGGLLTLPSVATYTANNLANFLTFSAQAASSKVSLPALTTVVFQGNTLTLKAQTGGTIDCPQLTTLTYTSNGVLSLNATGANSLINVPLLGNAPQINVNATVATGGTINWGSPTSLQQSNITLNTAGTINTTSLTNINATSLTATNGGLLALHSVATYTANNLANFLTFSAQAASSKVSLPALTTVVFQGNTLTLSAQTGGTIDCPQLSTLTYTSNGVLSLNATGANSLVNVPLLGNAPQVDVYATVATGGTINWGSPTTLQQSSITINTNGTINTTALTNIDATNLTATGGATLTLPSLTAYTANSFLNILGFSAQNANSKISLPAMTTLHFSGNSLSLTTQSGGTIDLHNLSTVTTTGNIFEELAGSSSNAGSIINLSSLLSTRNFPCTFTVADNGEILLGAFPQPFIINFTAEFTNASGPLDLYFGNTLFAAIPPNNLNTTENYQFSVPGSAISNPCVTFQAAGTNANIIITNYAATVPEPASLALLAAGTAALLTRRKRVNTVASQSGASFQSRDRKGATASSPELTRKLPFVSPPQF